jgi:hypothetical protein
MMLHSTSAAAKSGRDPWKASLIDFRNDQWPAAGHQLAVDVTSRPRNVVIGLFPDRREAYEVDTITEFEGS